MRTMRDVWDERRKGARSRPDRPGIVRRFEVTSPAKRHRPPRGTVPVRTWVFAKKPAGRGLEKQLLVKRTKEPEVDLFHEQDELIVLAELPGVSEQDIKVNVEKDVLIIEAVSTGARGEVHYYKEVMLPYEVRKDLEPSYKRGVLEIHLRPKRRAARRMRTKKGKRESSVRDGQPEKKQRRLKSESKESKKKRKEHSH